MLDRYLLPTHYLEDIYQLRAADLKAQGIRAIVTDIDNTLVTYDDAVPTPAVLSWYAEMAQAGIAIALVSNNGKDERVNTFNAETRFFATAHGGKPFGRGVKQALAAMGVAPREAVMIGDQIFTDVLAGARLGMMTVLVKPIKDRTDWFFRMKRRLERPLLRRYARREQRRKEQKGEVG